MVGGNYTTTAIITGGLTNGPACQGIITTRFSLYCTEEAPPPTGGGGGGGPYPGNAWNKFDSAWDIYTPTEIQPGPYDQETLAKHGKIVVLKVDIGNIHVEKIYKVEKRHAGMIVGIFGLYDATKTRITVNIKKLKRVAHRFTAKIWNLRKEK